eukprot:CFRG4715T1
MRCLFIVGLTTLLASHTIWGAQFYIAPSDRPMVLFSPGVEYQLLEADVDNSQFTIKLTFSPGSKLVSVRSKDNLSGYIAKGTIQHSENAVDMKEGGYFQAGLGTISTLEASQESEFPAVVLLYVNGEIEYLDGDNVVGKDNSRTILDKYSHGHTYLGQVDGQPNIDDLLDKIYANIRSADTGKSAVELAKAARTEFIVKHLGPAVGVHDKKMSPAKIVLLAMNEAPKDLYDAFLTLPHSAETVMDAMKLEKKYRNGGSEHERQTEQNIFPQDIINELELEAEKDREIAANRHRVASEEEDGQNKDLMPDEALQSVRKLAMERLSAFSSGPVKPDDLNNNLFKGLFASKSEATSKIIAAFKKNLASKMGEELGDLDEMNELSEKMKEKEEEFLNSQTGDEAWERV